MLYYISPNEITEILKGLNQNNYQEVIQMIHADRRLVFSIDPSTNKAAIEIIIENKFIVKIENYDMLIYWLGITQSKTDSLSFEVVMTGDLLIVENVYQLIPDCIETLIDSYDDKSIIIATCNSYKFVIFLSQKNERKKSY